MASAFFYEFSLLHNILVTQDLFPIGVPDLQVIDFFDTFFFGHADCGFNDRTAPWTLFIADIEVEGFFVFNFVDDDCRFLFDEGMILIDRNAAVFFA